MIRTTSQDKNYVTDFSDGTHASTCDAPVSKGGGELGFTPHALLEASLATCLNITLRVYAQAHDIAIGDVVTTVTLVQGEKTTTFEYGFTLSQPVTDEQLKRLHASLRGCPIHAILSKPVEIVQAEG